MRILCTGGCGFLGSNLTAAAIARGDEVWVLDNLSRVGSEKNLAYLRENGLKNFTQGDTRDPDAVNKIMAEAKPDVVFHVAGQVAMTTSLASPMDDARINIIGTLNVLEAVRAHAPDAAVIYSSTNKVYGDLETVPIDEEATRYRTPTLPMGFAEDTPLDFRSPYGCSKGAADQYVLDYSRMFGVKGIVFRHSSMYGDRQFATEDQGWVGWFVMKALEISRLPDRRGTIHISGTGKQVRDMLNAEDMVDLYLKAADNAASIAGNAFNIGGGMANSRSVLELFADLEEFLDCKIDVDAHPWRASDQKVFVADLAKINALLGWSPKVGCREGVQRMVSWIQSQYVA